MIANLEAFHSLVTNFWPVTRSFSMYGRSSPSLDVAAQNLRASALYCSIAFCGSTMLPFDFDIFFPRVSRAWPEMMTSFQGFVLKWSWDLMTVLNSQNVMMSWACGLNDIGYNFLKMGLSLYSHVESCGVN